MIKTFQSCLCPGIENVYLVSKTGALVLAANNHESVKTIGAIVSNIWSDYDSISHPENNAEGLKSMIIEADQGVISVESISSMYLCVQGGNEIGRLLEISKKLKEVLEEPLQEIVEN